MMNTTHLLGIVAGTLTAVSMLPQLFKVIKEKEVKDLSTSMITLLIAGLSCWIIYGILINDIPIIATNGFSVMTNLVLIWFKIRYRNNG